MKYLIILLFASVAFAVGESHFPSGVIAPSVGVSNTANSSLVTIKSPPSPTPSPYSFNLPATQGASGYLLTSGGGGTAPQTWSSPIPQYVLPSPQPSVLGGVFNRTCGGSNFVTGIDGTGAPTCGTPAGSGTVTNVVGVQPITVASPTTTPFISVSPLPNRTVYGNTSGVGAAPSPVPYSNLFSVDTNNYRVEFAQLSMNTTSSTVVSSSGSWISYSSYSSPKTTFSFTAGEFTGAPMCECTPFYSGASSVAGGVFTCNITAISTSAITLIVSSSVGEAFASTFYASLMCHGLH